VPGLRALIVFQIASTFALFGAQDVEAPAQPHEDSKTTVP